MIAAYRSIAPSAFNLLTRVQQDDADRPTFAASSPLVAVDQVEAVVLRGRRLAATFVPSDFPEAHGSQRHKLLLTGPWVNRTRQNALPLRSLRQSVRCPERCHHLGQHPLLLCPIAGREVKRLDAA